MTAASLRPRWGQPVTGIVAFITFFVVALGLWFVFSDMRGPIKAFPYPFVMYLAVMILVGVWQHMLLGDWPFANLPQPLRGLVETAVNLVATWFVIHVVFYKVIGLAYNFMSQDNLDALAASGKAIMANGQPMALDAMQKAHYAQSAIVAFVLISFFSYPFVTILFDKWPIRPSNLTQPQAGLAEFGWTSLLTAFFFAVLIVPFWGVVYGRSIAINTSWWAPLAGTGHLHWVFGFWEWMIILLFMTANVWRGKPWSAMSLPQPLKGLVSFIVIVVVAYVLSLVCIKVAPSWLPQQTLDELAAKNDLLRFLNYHSAEIGGFTLIPFLCWHHYFDDAVPMKDKDSWAAFGFRTVGVMLLAALNYWFFYYAGFVHWGIGNEHAAELAHAFPQGESLVWNFWWIIPLLWNEWFFHKWPFYVAGDAAGH